LKYNENSNGENRAVPGVQTWRGESHFSLLLCQHD